MSILNIVLMIVLFLTVFIILLFLLPKIFSKNFKEKSNANEILIITIVISMFFLGITYLIALFFKKSHFIEQVGSTDAWISFAGLIMGGLITMMALYFTLKNGEEENKKNHILSLKPFLVCNIKNVENFEVNYNNGIPNYGDIQCEISNPSNNIANEIRMIGEFSSIKTENNSFVKVHDLFNEYGITLCSVLNNCAFFLAPNQSYNWKTSFGIKWDEEIEFKEATFTLRHTVVFEFTDVSNLQKYHLNFEYDLGIHTDLNNTVHLYLENIRNTIDFVNFIKQ